MSEDVKEVESGNNTDQDKGHGDKPETKTLLVVVYTTSGNYPRSGYEEVKLKELVSKFLHKAAKELHLTDVTDWDATVGGNIIDPSKTFAENSLTGTVTIQWAPREGGGG